MRTRRFAPLAGVLLALIWLSAQQSPAAAADGDPYLGKWTGTFLGESTAGHFELDLQRGSEGAVTGTITVSTDGDSNSDYTAKLKSASFTGNKFSAVYEPPGDGQTEINLKGIFNPKGADGDWSVNPKAQPTAVPVATGTWKIIKQ
jgi:hypothetical protein